MTTAPDHVRLPDLRLDLGCGGSKKAGCIGLDSVAAPGVDHVIDLTHERWPFADESVEYAFSSHFFEHIPEPNHVFMELGRVARNGARFEFWTPYTFTEEGFFYGHVAHFSERLWLEFCFYHRDAFVPLLGGRWLLHAVTYIVPDPTVQSIRQQGFSLNFAIRHFKDVAIEFGVEIEFRRELELPAVLPQRYYAPNREAPRSLLAAEPQPMAPSSTSDLQAMVRQLETTIEQKNSHIRQLEQLIGRLEAGRVMRLLRWAGQRRSRS
ncbi:MAG: methyltransferase domain-containing protein [Candidatus Viridilinea halotolerans]|uniref:Methyltransferase domain-containing protein n=1 Tax=Candidatus Viridilinea halotolerans TaxID=2491704 RepID=A0A426U083_9CHLR|nr:MAG: methyltransferase domain-containing protein [Candidatus Viridilinea halotolerans]